MSSFVHVIVNEYFPFVVNATVFSPSILSTIHPVTPFTGMVEQYLKPAAFQYNVLVPFLSSPNITLVGLAFKLIDPSDW